STRLGVPVGQPTRVDSEGIEYQMFATGALFGVPGQPVVAILGDFFSRWKDLGGIDSPLGYPTSDPDQVAGTTVQDFSRGWMVSVPNAGVLSVGAGDSSIFPLLVSNAAMLDVPGGLALWTPGVDDLN